MRAIGVRTFPTDTYFFLADFAPHDAGTLSQALAEHGILVKPLGDARLGPGYMRITTALPEDNARFLTALRELLDAPDAASTDSGSTSCIAARRAPANGRASGTLSESEIGVLREALDDEYRAWATYDQVIADFGDVRPFSNIRDAEARHVQALAALFARYEVHMPANPWPGRVERYASLHAACEAGVVAEMANVALYERLIASTQRPDILRVLRRLQEASQERHLRAFRRCVQRGSGCGGRGRGNRGGTMHRR